jgi:hypothetical protein
MSSFLGHPPPNQVTDLPIGLPGLPPIRVYLAARADARWGGELTAASQRESDTIFDVYGTFSVPTG